VKTCRSIYENIRIQTGGILQTLVPVDMVLPASSRCRRRPPLAPRAATMRPTGPVGDLPLWIQRVQPLLQIGPRAAAAARPLMDDGPAAAAAPARRAKARGAHTLPLSKLRVETTGDTHVRGADQEAPYPAPSA
jgi:hypothetical protein